MLMGTGIKRVEVRSPEYTVVPDGSVAVAEGEATMTNGGAERE